MPAINPALLFTRKLDDVGVRYMVTGSVAATIYGEPRLTNDVDIVARIEVAQVAPLSEAFPLSQFYFPPEEVVRIEIARTHRGHFNVIHHATGFKADVYLAGQERLHEWGMANRRQIEIEGTAISVAPPEYVIVRKLGYYREGGSEKHVNDIRAMLRCGTARIELETVARLAAEDGLMEAWELAQRQR